MTCSHSDGRKIFLCRSNCSTIFSSTVSQSFDTLDRSDTVFFFFFLSLSLSFFLSFLERQRKENSRTFFDHIEFPKEDVVVSENSFGKSFVAGFRLFVSSTISHVFLAVPFRFSSFPRMTVNDASLSALIHILTLMAKCT